MRQLRYSARWTLMQTRSWKWISHALTHANALNGEIMEAYQNVIEYLQPLIGSEVQDPKEYIPALVTSTELKYVDSFISSLSS